MLKVLHCADFHLDVPFSAKDAAASAQRRRQLRQMLTRVVDIALEKKADLLLIAGDLFERNYLSYPTANHLMEQLNRLAGVCRVVIAPGNHDPFQSDSPYAKLPFGAHVFVFTDSRLSHFDFPDLRARVYGYAFTEANHPAPPLADFQKESSPETDYTLLCAHTEFGNPSSLKAPILQKDLEKGAFDYAAFGHIHRATPIQSIQKTRYAYCGSADGLDFGECGKKSVYYIEMDKVGKDTVFAYEQIPTSPRHYEILKVNVEGATEFADLKNPILRAIQKGGYDENTALRIILEGAVHPQTAWSQSALLASLPQLLYAEIVDNTHPLLDHETLLEDIGIRGAFYRALLPQLEGADPDIRNKAILALRYGLCALNGEEFPQVEELSTREIAKQEGADVI